MPHDKKSNSEATTFQFQCVPGRHKFSLDIDTGERGHDFQAPEYKERRMKIFCPECGVSAAKGKIEDIFATPSAVSDVDQRRRDNRAITADARRQAAAHRQGDAPGDKMVRLPDVRGRDPRYGGNVEVPQKVLESLNEKGKMTGHVGDGPLGPK